MTSSKKNILYLGPKSGGAATIVSSIADFFGCSYHCSIKSYLFACFSSKSDIIHTALPVINFRGVPVLLHVHGNYAREYSFRHPLTFLYPLAVRFAKQIFVPSKTLAKELRLDATVIPNFLQKKPVVGDKKSTYVTVTSFDFKKKAYGVLKIAKALAKQNAFSWVVVGDGRYKNEVESQVQKIVGSKVMFVGRKSHPFKHIGDVFLYWSELETFGLVLLEAKAAGMPIVCNNFPAMREVLTSEYFLPQEFVLAKSAKEFSAAAKRFASKKVAVSRLPVAKLKARCMRMWEEVYANV